jgi:hypothetical protein
MISRGTGRPLDPPLYDRLWGSGFLPSKHQGVKFRGVGDPVLFLSNPDGIAGGVRVVYVPEAAAVVLHDLRPGATHAPTMFDPVTGEKAKLPPLHSDDAGNATCAPPAGCDHDWVLLLDAEKAGPPK